MSNQNYIQAMLIQKYRQQCGLSQAALAKRLGTTRTQISMVESGKRSLPPGAADLLEKLIAAVNRSLGAVEKNSGPSQSSPDELMVFKKELKEKASEALYRRLVLSRKLRAMIASYPAMLDTYNLLVQQSIDTSLSDDPVAGYRVHLLKWKKKLEQCNRASQLELQLKTDLLLAEATVITKFLESC
jgi:transcriptional regulator with XRE-family HTH domain